MFWLTNIMQKDEFHIHQQKYILPQQEILFYLKLFCEFRFLSSKALWVTNSRPKIRFEGAKLTHITEETFNENGCKIINIINQIVIIVIDLLSNSNIALEYT